MVRLRHLGAAFHSQGVRRGGGAVAVRQQERLGQRHRWKAFAVDGTKTAVHRDAVVPGLGTGAGEIGIGAAAISAPAANRREFHLQGGRAVRVPSLQEMWDYLERSGSPQVGGLGNKCLTSSIFETA